MRLIERRVDLAGVAHALGDFEAQVARHQRLGLVDLDVVEVGSLLAADLQKVTKAVGGDKAGLDAAMLDEGIGRHRGAVAEIDDRSGRMVAGLGRCAAHALLHALGNAARRIVRRRRNFPGLDPPRLLIEQADVGEGAARVYADAPSCHAVPCLPGYAGVDVTTAVPLIVRPETIIHIGDESPPDRRGHRRLSRRVMDRRVRSSRSPSRDAYGRDCNGPRRL
jgi:hypothetical protein